MMLVNRLWFASYTSVMALAILAVFPTAWALIALLAFRPNPERIVDISVGRLRFHVANKYLVVPWPNNESPDAEAMLMARITKQMHLPSGLDDRQSLSMKFDLPDLSPGTLHNDRSVIAILDYKGIQIVPRQTVAAMVNFGDARGIVTRAPDVDTARYSAFWLRPWAPFAHSLKAENTSEGRHSEEVRYVSKSGTAPQGVDCLFAYLPNRHPADCTTVAALFADRFAPFANGKPPYTISLTIPLDQIDVFQKIISAVSAKLQTFISS